MWVELSYMEKKRIKGILDRVKKDMGMDDEEPIINPEDKNEEDDYY